MVGEMAKSHIGYAGRLSYVPVWKRNLEWCLRGLLLIFFLTVGIIGFYKNGSPRVSVGPPPTFAFMADYDKRSQAGINLIASNPSLARETLEDAIGVARRQGVLPLPFYPTEGEQALLHLYLRDAPSKNAAGRQEFMTYMKRAYPRFDLPLRFEQMRDGSKDATGATMR